jgi:hypothetical protein
MFKEIPRIKKIKKMATWLISKAEEKWLWAPNFGFTHATNGMINRSHENHVSSTLS